ncbi:MAG: pyridoxamine 5'-phosphate oxidase family protein [Gammaproteobacteria bacterium]|nr:pyridoxamine 5'-phosphate oxidase family protein [Gammaproteobacteria bacterium]
MAKTYPALTPELKSWIMQQPVFFLASAPLQANGHINVSPRGLDSLRILDDHALVILDLTGSGNETAAHLHENGRLTVMLCAFSGDPKILRLYGQGKVVWPDSAGWGSYRKLFSPELPGVRQIFHLQLDRIQTSCGFGVPLMDFVAQRDTLSTWARKKGPDGIDKYQHDKNARSIDGLPAPGLCQD